MGTVEIRFGQVSGFYDIDDRYCNMFKKSVTTDLQLEIISTEEKRRKCPEGDIFESVNTASYVNTYYYILRKYLISVWIIANT